MNDEFLLGSPEELDPQLRFEHYPVIIPDLDYPAMVMSHEVIRFWCELDEDFNPELLSPISGIHHGLSYFIQECGLNDLLGWRKWPCDEYEVTSALNCGLTYRQPFYIEASCVYTTSYGQDGPEHDTETDWEILHIRQILKETIIANFYEWLSRSDQFNETKNIGPTILADFN